jgi:hypothetical protein
MTRVTVLCLLGLLLGACASSPSRTPPTKTPHLDVRPLGAVQILGVTIYALPASLPNTQIPGVRADQRVKPLAEAGWFQNLSSTPVCMLAGEVWTGEYDYILAESGTIPPFGVTKIPTRRIGAGLGGATRQASVGIRFADPFVRMENILEEDPFSPRLAARWAAYYMGDWTGKARSSYAGAWSKELERATDYCLDELDLLKDERVHGLRMYSYDFLWECEDSFASRAQFAGYARDLLRSYLVAASILGRPEPPNVWRWGEGTIETEEARGGIFFNNGTEVAYSPHLVPPSYFCWPFDYVRQSNAPGLLPVSRTLDLHVRSYETRVSGNGPVLHRFRFNECNPDGSENPMRPERR